MISPIRPHAWFLVIPVSILLGIAPGARASVVAVLTERPSDILIEVSGSIDTDAFSGFSSSTGNFVLGTTISSAGFRVAPPTGTAGDSTTYFLDNFYVSFATGFTSGSFITGDIFVVADNGSSDQIRLSETYVSGSPISSSGTYPGDFAARGITSTSDVVMNLPGSQTITVQFVPIPEPGALPAAVLGAASLLLVRRPRRSPSGRA